jgi:anti-anti-sigma factor
MTPVPVPEPKSVPASALGDAFALTVVSIDHHDVHLRAAGELDLAAVPSLNRLLKEHRDAGRPFARLDVSAVTFLDCSCLGVLLRAHQASLAARGILVLDGVSPRLERLLRLTHLETTLFHTHLIAATANPTPALVLVGKPTVLRGVRPPT